MVPRSAALQKRRSCRFARLAALVTRRPSVSRGTRRTARITRATLKSRLTGAQTRGQRHMRCDNMAWEGHHLRSGDARPPRTAPGSDGTGDTGTRRHGIRWHGDTGHGVTRRHGIRWHGTRDTGWHGGTGHGVTRRHGVTVHANTAPLVTRTLHREMART